MRRAVIFACFIFVMFLAWIPDTSRGSSDQLALKFREGQTIKYRYQETQTYTPPAKFAGTVSSVLDVRADYTLKVTRVNADRSAIVKIYFENVVVTKDGRQIADITDHQIPDQGQDVTAILKVNGDVSFGKFVYLTLNVAGQPEYRIVTGGNPLATHTRSPEGEKQLFAADLDVQSGMIKVGVPPTRTVPEPDYNKLAEFKIDLTPRKLHQLLLIPTAPFAAGRVFRVSNPHLSHQETTLEGITDIQGYQCQHLESKITPWATSDEGNETEYEPQVSGSIDYYIEPDLGRVIMARGQFKTEILVPGVGLQLAETVMSLTLRK